MHAEKPDNSLIEAAKAVSKRRWKLAAAVFVLAVGAATSFVYSLPSIYSATATVLLNQAGAPGPASDNAATPSIQLDSVTEEVLSRDRLEDIVKRFDLYPALRRKASPETVLERMRRDIRIDRKTGTRQWGQEQTFAFTVRYQGWDPQVVAAVTNALVYSFVTETTRMQDRQATGSLDSLHKQLTALRQKLDEQENRINTFKSSHLGELPEQQSANLLTLQQLNEQLRENTDDQAKLMQRREALLKGAVDAGNASLAQLEQEEANLLTRYTDKYPDVVRIRAEIAARKREQSGANGVQSRDRTASPLEEEYDALGSELETYKAEETKLRAEIGDYRKRIENVPLRALQLQALTQGYDETQSLYSALQKRYDETRLEQSSSNGGHGLYRVIDPAVAPKDASGPDRSRLLFMAIVLAIGLSAGVTFMAEQMDASFHSASHLRGFTRVPVLASIPHIVTPADSMRRRMETVMLIISLVVALLILIQLFRLMGNGNETVVWLLSRRGA
jgi:polysaccharide chain length determinant protein (PEP-CTERM system associated)